MTQSVEKRFAQLYDASVPDWPGEIDFYRARAAGAKRDELAVLEDDSSEMVWLVRK